MWKTKMAALLEDTFEQTMEGCIHRTETGWRAHSANEARTSAHAAGHTGRNTKGVDIRYTCESSTNINYNIATDSPCASTSRAPVTMSTFIHYIPRP